MADKNGRTVSCAKLLRNSRYKTDREREIPLTTQGTCLPQGWLSEGSDFQIPFQGVIAEVSLQSKCLCLHVCSCALKIIPRASTLKTLSQAYIPNNSCCL